jgi:hypothetical protein
MSIFFDLFVQGSRAADPSWADRRFPDVVAQSPFRVWHPGDPIPAKGTRLLVGVATWSGYDMRLLDVIAEAVTRAGSGDQTLEVFNTAECKQPGDFAAYVPNRWELVNTPVAGVWLDGTLNWSGQGAGARDHLAQMFGSGSGEITRYVRDHIEAQSLTRGA